MTLRLVQLDHPSLGRRVAFVDEPKLTLIRGPRSIYELSKSAIESSCKLARVIESAGFEDSIDYDAVYRDRSEWKLLPAFDFPDHPSRCFVTGTGLTHKASAENRQSMHGKASDLTDSMKMYKIGI